MHTVQALSSDIVILLRRVASGLVTGVAVGGSGDTWEGEFLGAGAGAGVTWPPWNS